MAALLLSLMLWARRHEFPAAVLFDLQSQLSLRNSITMTLRLLSISLVILGLFGCSSSTDSASPNSSENAPYRGTIGVSLMTLTNPFFIVIGDSITKEAQAHGYDVVVLGADENPDKQNNQVTDFIVQKVDAIVLAPYDSRAIGPAIGQAAEAGIPVFTVDTGCLAPDCKVISHVATDNKSGGKQAALAMIEAIGPAGGGKIAILEHALTESCLLRTEGFKEVIDEYNQDADNKIDIVSQIPCGGNRSQGYEATQAILQSDGDVVGIFAINDPSALGSYAALVDANKQDQVTLIGFDGQPEGKKAIRDGRIYADPIQFPDRMGVKIVELIMKHFEGEQIEPRYLIQTELYRKADADNDPSLDSPSS